jgi:hypothetical protein
MFHIGNVGVELAIIVMSGSSDAFEDRFDSIKLAYPNIVPGRFRSEVGDEEQWNGKDPLRGVWSSPCPVGLNFRYGSQHCYQHAAHQIHSPKAEMNCPIFQAMTTKPVR